MTPASSACPQLWSPHGRLEQSMSDDSFPRHSTSSSQMTPAPAPKVASDFACPPLKYYILLSSVFLHFFKGKIVTVFIEVLVSENQFFLIKRSTIGWKLGSYM
jgi:hypothetical protein